MINNIFEWLSQPWPWYVAGPIIGLLVPLLLLTGNKQFGISSTFRDICSYSFPKSKISYFRYTLSEFKWRNLIIVGVVLGAVFCNVFLDNPQNIQISDKTVLALNEIGITSMKGWAPIDIFSLQNLFTIKGAVIIIGGGLLIGFGTRWADGCTSGHAITGLSLLSPASLVAVIGFFIGGLAATYFLLPYLIN